MTQQPELLMKQRGRIVLGWRHGREAQRLQVVIQFILGKVTYGTVLASPYNKAINNAGTSSTYNRGAAWDIGAYEYTYDGGTIVNTGAVFGGISF